MCTKCWRRVSPSPSNMRQRTGTVTEDDESIIHRSLNVTLGDPSGRDSFDITRYPASIIVIMDHEIHQNSARLDLVEEPVAHRLLWPVTATVQADNPRFADLALCHSCVSQGIYREKANNVSNKQ